MGIMKREYEAWQETQERTSILTDLPLADFIAQREGLLERLAKAIGHLPVENQLYIVTSYMSVDTLEDVVNIQEGANT